MGGCQHQSPWSQQLRHLLAAPPGSPQRCAKPTPHNNQFIALVFAFLSLLPCSQSRWVPLLHQHKAFARVCGRQPRVELRHRRGGLGAARKAAPAGGRWGRSREGSGAGGCYSGVQASGEPAPCAGGALGQGQRADPKDSSSSPHCAVPAHASRGAVVAPPRSHLMSLTVYAPTGAAVLGHGWVLHLLGVGVRNPRGLRNGLREWQAAGEGGGGG